MDRYRDGVIEAAKRYRETPTEHGLEILLKWVDLYADHVSLCRMMAPAKETPELAPYAAYRAAIVLSS